MCNMMFFKVMKAGFATVAVLLLGTTAYAGGGKAERPAHLRQRATSAQQESTRPATTGIQTAAQEQRSALHTPDFGRYVREGKMLRVSKNAQPLVSKRKERITRRTERTGTQIVHEHGPGGKTHRNVKVQKEN